MTVGEMPTRSFVLIIWIPHPLIFLFRPDVLQQASRFPTASQDEASLAVCQQFRAQFRLRVDRHSESPRQVDQQRPLYCRRAPARQVAAL